MGDVGRACYVPCLVFVHSANVENLRCFIPLDHPLERCSVDFLDRGELAIPGGAVAVLLECFNGAPAFNAIQSYSSEASLEPLDISLETDQRHPTSWLDIGAN